MCFNCTILVYKSKIDIYKQLESLFFNVQIEQYVENKIQTEQQIRFYHNLNVCSAMILSSFIYILIMDEPRRANHASTSTPALYFSTVVFSQALVVCALAGADVGN